MLRAAIFDDEYIVIQGLQRMIDWSRYGIELVGTARDGHAALEVFRAQRPDLVLTDIRMPGLDGLQLVEQILQEAPETVCLVFSGFNEYEYVKCALKLGVADYLEKPITIPKIEEALRRTIDRISRQNELSTLRRKWAESRVQLLEKATAELLFTGAEALHRWREYFGEEADRVVGITVLALAGDGAPPTRETVCRVVGVRHESNRLTVLFHLTPPDDDFWEDLAAWAEEAGFPVGAGRTYTAVADAGKSCREALRALRYGQFLAEGGLTRFEDIGENTRLPEGLSEQEEAVIFFLRTANKDGLLQELDRFTRRLQSERVAPEVAECEVLRLVYLAMEVAKETGGDPWTLWPPGYLPQVELREQHTREAMCRWFQSQMERIMDWIIAVRQESKHAAVTKAVRYIEEHYHRDLTLQEVSDQVNMNPTYFSVLFKEQMGVTYIKYLTRVRMDNAKRLLQQGMLVQEVSERVGYHQYRHFVDVFKRTVGMTPGQYRELVSKDAR